MSKVTTKLQVTMPKRIADDYAIRPGDEIDWEAAGDVIRIIPAGKRALPVDRALQLRMFDRATERVRDRATGLRAQKPQDRGWSREDLYRRGRPD